MQVRRVYLVAGFFFILFVVGAILLSQQARQSIPLRYAQIPEETKQFLREMERLVGDVRIRFSEEPIEVLWGNETNEGEDARTGLLKKEDENFIFYYHRSADAKAKVEVVVSAARQAIPPLTQLFGKYYYPSDCNGRKLAFYICDDREEYYRLSGTTNPHSIAVTNLLFSPSGVICRGIYFAPETFADTGWRQGKSEEVQETVWHEMAHFVYFSSLDISQSLWQPLWVIEGIAEYFSGNYDRLREVNLRHLTPLCRFESPDMRNKWTSSAYWIGYTAFLYMEKDYTKNAVRQFLAHNYRLPPSPAVERTLSVPFAQFDMAWQNYVKSLKQTESSLH